MSMSSGKGNDVIAEISKRSRGNLFAKLHGGDPKALLEPGAAPEAALDRPSPAPRMPLQGGAEEHFLAKLTSERLTATVDHLQDINHVPQACQRYLAEHKIDGPLALAAPSPLAALEWPIAITHDLDLNQQAALTWADYGVAETGSLINLSSPATPLLFAMLPLYHICVLRRSRLLDYSEDLWRALAPAPLPRSLAFLTGTSGTADIEAKNVRGAHGPRFMHVLYLED